MSGVSFSPATSTFGKPRCQSPAACDDPWDHVWVLLDNNTGVIWVYSTKHGVAPINYGTLVPGEAVRVFLPR